MSGAGFDYEGAVWGRESVGPGDRSIAGVRLDEALRGLPPAGRVLELGCGAGRMLGGLARARPALALVGIDVSRAALAEAGALHPEVEFRVADSGARLPAADGEFAAVWLLDVLEHVDAPADTLRELHRVLAPGGVLHAHVPCEGDALSLWRWLPARCWRRKSAQAGHVQRFRRSELTGLLVACGFRIERTRYSLHLAGNLADVAATLALVLAERFGAGGAPATTGDLLASAQAPRAGAAARALAWLTRAVDAVLWLEARVLGALPSWAVHVTAVRS